MKSQKSEIESLEKKYAKLFYGLFKSKQREKLHKKTFGNEPINKTKFQDLILDENKIILPRLFSICNDINKNFSIIPNYVYHWTSKSNLASILENKYFFGSEVMNRRQIKFQKNALNGLDIFYGDANVICFCPFLVDASALMSEQMPPRLRENLVRLKIDLTQIDVIGKYNQFAKMYDYNSPEYRVNLKFNEQFSIFIHKIDSSMQINFKYGKSVGISKITSRARDIKKEKDIGKTLFYTNVNSINWFFSTKIIDLINKTKPEFRKILYDYLNTLSDEEITKIFVVTAQWLTLYSEYNFYSSLPVTNNLITEIYDINSGKSFKTCELIKSDLVFFDEKVQNANNSINFNGKENVLNQYGHEIKILPSESRAENKHLNIDVSKIPSELFISNYINTRDLMYLKEIQNQVSVTPKLTIT